MGFDVDAACDTSSEQATANFMALGVAIAFAVFVGFDTVVGWWVMRKKLRQVEVQYDY
tara:strand:+ start:550 stop:723 length:174 start_codon:yes stop_codon:yes gene_type:complete